MKLFIKITALIIFALGLMQCQNENHEHHHNGNENEDHQHHHGDANEHMHQTPIEELIERFENPERDEWQKPDEVIALLGVDSSQTWQDIGSGTGYFSFRLLEAGAKVICGDVDERFLAHIRQKRDSMGIDPNAMKLRKLPYDAPNLKEKEADGVLIVNTYHHIEDRQKYFGLVKFGLKEGGKLVVIDFFKKETPVGPPVEMKMSEKTVIDELKAAGFTEFEVNDELLPYQYVIVARG